MTNVLIDPETKLKMIVKINTLTSKRKISKTINALGYATYFDNVDNPDSFGHFDNFDNI